MSVDMTEVLAHSDGQTVMDDLTKDKMLLEEDAELEPRRSIGRIVRHHLLQEGSCLGVLSLARQDASDLKARVPGAGIELKRRGKMLQNTVSEWFRPLVPRWLLSGILPFGRSLPRYKDLINSPRSGCENARIIQLACRPGPLANRYCHSQRTSSPF